MKQLLRNMYVKNKRVILRCDFNVPIKNGNVLDETKIIKSLKTINYLLNTYTQACHHCRADQKRVHLQ